ncbi:MAG: HD-GYP domain-containing protein [Thermodesulfobacteriota bacterium]
MGIRVDPNLLNSLLVLGTIIEAKDPFTGGHVWRVAEYSKLIAEKAGLSKQECFKAYISGYVHDIGKVGIPDNILNKTMSLTKDEYEIIKTHTTIGGEILRAHPLAPIVRDSVVHHHERIDGNGYPDGLVGTRIDFITKIVAVADTFDALTSVRPYKEIIPSEKAIYLLNGQKDKRFDDKLVSLLIDAVENNELDQVIGHSWHFRPLISCHQCGPVISVNTDKKNGDLISCNVCHGKYKLHTNDNVFELEYLEDQSTVVTSEIDYNQISQIVDTFPEDI